MTYSVVVTSISGCGVFTVCRVVWAYHIRTYFYWSIPQYCSFNMAQHTLPEDGPIGPKHVAANIEIF